MARQRSPTPPATPPRAAEPVSPHQMWGGRFAAGPEESFAVLNRSLPVDYRLWPYDVRASKAWVHAIGQAGILTPAEEATLLEGLDRVGERLADGAGVGAPDEDVHTLVERLLYEEVGDVAGKLHTGRSRNDQVATDLRLWCLDAIATVSREVTALASSLVGQAQKSIDLILPGYTHGQQAQPVRWAYVLLAHAWPLVRDQRRLSDAGRRVAELPLGSGALAGSGVPVDRVLLKEALGFRSVSPNALDATGERDFAAEILFVISLVAMHVSRLASELVTYSSTEYGFVRLADGYCTGSSLLPQKRNPDVFELARAKSARTIADLVGLLTMLKGLPAGYNKDLQEDKTFLFDAVDTMLATLPAVRGAVDTLQPVPERMLSAINPGVLATDLADGLVGHGVPFREAHGLVGQLVREAERLGLALTAIPPKTAAAIHPRLPELIAALGSFPESVERRATAGGSSRASVEAQILELQQELSASRS